MAGIDRFTGAILEGWGHVAQSVQVILTTMIGTRVMRRPFGSAVPALLGRSLSASLILRWKTAIIVALELWEPRVRVIAIETLGEEVNTPERLRTGRLGLRVRCAYRPRGHLGDPTEDPRDRNLDIGRAATGSYEVNP